MLVYSLVKAVAMRCLGRFILPLLFLLTACGQGIPQIVPTIEASPTSNQPSPTPPATVVSSADIAQITESNASTSGQQGTIRIVNAAIETPAINAISGIEAIATNLDYTQASEPTPLSAGEHDLKIVPSGSKPGDSPLFETTFMVKEGDSVVLVVAKQGDTFTLLTFPEVIEPLNENESIITILNAVSGTSSVAVQQNNTDLVEAIPFGEIRTSGILPSGDTSLTLQAGEQSQAFNINLQEKHHYFLILAGNTTSISIASFSDQTPGRAEVRAINASEALPAVDVYVDQTLIAERAEFGRPTSRQTINAGQYAVTVYEAGGEQAGAVPLVSDTIDIPGGQNTALILLGSGSNIMIVPYIEDLSPTPVNETRIAFLNTVEDVPTLHLETTGGPLPDVPDMGFGQPPTLARLSPDVYTFYLTRVGGNDPNKTVENAQNIQLEAGIAYLYLVTGRLDGEPIIISERVGIDENLSNTGDSTQVSNEPALLRFINAIGDQTPVDFVVNDNVVGSNRAYGQSSAFVPIYREDATVSVNRAGTTDLLQLVDTTLASSTNYTIIAYGQDATQVNLLVIPDTELIFDGRSPHVRLINLSLNTDTILGLGFSPQAPTPQAEVTAEATEDLRRSLPGGVQRVIENIGGGDISPVILMPEGIFDLYVLDSITNQSGIILTGIDLSAGEHYDIITYEEQDITRIQAFILPYPARSG